MRLVLWSPPVAPESAWMARLAPHLAGRAELVRVEAAGQEPGDRDARALDLYEIADDPAHAFVWRAAQARPGVVVLRDWGLHRLVAGATLDAGDVAAYLREMRRAYGATGLFVARQAARGFGGLLPWLFPANHRVLEGALGVVAAHEPLRARAAAQLPSRPVLGLPLDLLRPRLAFPTREAARRALGIDLDAPAVAVAGEGVLARGPVVARALDALRREWPRLAVLSLDAAAPAHERGRAILAAADAVVALRFPASGGVPEVVARGLEAGRPVLVSAGTLPALALPEGVVIGVDPDATEQAQLAALLDRLLRDHGLRARVGALARAHVDAVDAAGTADALLAFAEAVLAERDETAHAIRFAHAAEGTLLGYGLEEVRRAARELGIVTAGAPLGVEPLLTGLLGQGPTAETGR